MAKDKSLTQSNPIAPNLTSLTDSDILPPEMMRQLENKLPQWLQEYEADGTAIMRWNQELFILFEYILQRDFDFTEDDIDKFILKFKELLPEVAKLKVDVPRLLDKKDFHIAREMVERNKQVFKAQKAGIALPNKQAIKQIK